MRQQGLAHQRQPEGALSLALPTYMYVIFALQANQVWDDIGFGGKKGSIWSSPSAMKSMAVLTEGALNSCTSGGSTTLIVLIQANRLNSKISNLLLSWHPMGEALFLSIICSSTYTFD